MPSLVPEGHEKPRAFIAKLSPAAADIISNTHPNPALSQPRERVLQAQKARLARAAANSANAADWINSPKRMESLPIGPRLTPVRREKSFNDGFVASAQHAGVSEDTLSSLVSAVTSGGVFVDPLGGAQVERDAHTGQKIRKAPGGAVLWSCTVPQAGSGEMRLYWWEHLDGGVDFAEILSACAPQQSPSDTPK